MKMEKGGERGGGVTDISKNDWHWVMRVIKGPLIRGDIISCLTFLNVSLCWLELFDNI